MRPSPPLPPTGHHHSLPGSFADSRLYGSSADLSGGSSEDSQGNANVMRLVPQPSQSYNNLLNASSPDQPTRFLWVGNLTLKATRPQLCAVFEKFGLLEDLVSFPGRIYAFVTYQSVEAAVAAQQALQGVVLKEISADSGLVIKFRPERKVCAHLSEASTAAGNDAEAVEPSPRIWLGNISPTATAANLQSVLGRFGTLVDAAVFPARIGPLGYAFVKFERVQDAVNAYNTLNNAVVPALSGSKQVKMRYKPVSEGAPRDTTLDALQASIPSRHIWIGNVTQKPSEDALIRIFSRYGAIESARVFSAKSYAFVNFFEVASAVEAITKLDGVSVPVLTGLKPLVMRYQHDANSGSGSGGRSQVDAGVGVGVGGGVNTNVGMNDQSNLNAKVLELLNRSRIVPDSHPSESDLSMDSMQSMTTASTTDPSKLAAILHNLAALNSSINGGGFNGGGLNGGLMMNSSPMNNNNNNTGYMTNNNGMNMMQDMNMQNPAMQSSLLWPSASQPPAHSHTLHHDGPPSAFSPWN